MSVVIGAGSRRVATDHRAPSRATSPVPRLRASGDAVEFGRRDLALDASAPNRSSSRIRSTSPPTRPPTSLDAPKDWPVGLHLAALIAGDSGADGLAITGDTRYVADYLYREALSRLPEEDQRFLRRTAVVDQLCASLCDAVVDGVGAQERLRRLEAANLIRSQLLPAATASAITACSANPRPAGRNQRQRNPSPSAMRHPHLRAADGYEATGRLRRDGRRSA